LQRIVRGHLIALLDLKSNIGRRVVKHTTGLISKHNRSSKMLRTFSELTMSRSSGCFDASPPRSPHPQFSLEPPTPKPCGSQQRRQFIPGRTTNRGADVAMAGNVAACGSVASGPLHTVRVAASIVAAVFVVVIRLLFAIDISNDSGGQDKRGESGGSLRAPKSQRPCGR
jgi:hypothetical protein